jgi:hypothetical protein
MNYRVLENLARYDQSWTSMGPQFPKLWRRKSEVSGQGCFGVRHTEQQHFTKPSSLFQSA